MSGQTPIGGVVGGCGIAGAVGGASCGQMLPNTGVGVAAMVGVAATITAAGTAMIVLGSRKKRIRTVPDPTPDAALEAWLEKMNAKAAELDAAFEKAKAERPWPR